MQGSADVEASAEEMWDVFADVASWPAWNRCIWRARVDGGHLQVGATLRWVFNPVRWYLPYKLPARAEIVECEPGRKVTWEVRIPGFHALHSYLIEPVDDRRCRFGSWEVAEGPLYRWLRPFWMAHFDYVCRTSLESAVALGEARRPGVRLRRYGPSGGATPLVAVPGIDGSVGSIAPIVEELARSRPVVVVDYSSEQNPTLEALAQEVTAAVTSAGLGPVDLMGQSIGTVVAALVAASGQVEVRRVVLVATFTRARWFALRVANLASQMTPGILYRLSVVPLMAAVCGPVGGAWRHPFFAAVRRADPVSTRRRTAWQIDRDFGPHLRAIPQPVRVVMGRRDRFVPDAGAAISTMRSMFGSGAVVEVEGAGHVMLADSAVARTVAAIAEFTAGPDPAPGEAGP